jgi:hypothetical protein
MFALPLAAIAADAPMPQLRVEAEASGSIFNVKNTYSQPLTALFIELVDFPSETYAFTRDELGAGAVAAGTEKKILVANPTPGAAPANVKVTAAVYADGETAGAPDKVKHILTLRKGRLDNTREILQRIETAQKDGKDKDAMVADLRQWATTVVPPPPAGMQPITDPAKTVKRNMIALAASNIAKLGVDAELARLKKSESELAASKPVL